MSNIVLSLQKNILCFDMLTVDVLQVLDLAALSWHPFLSPCTQLYRTLKCVCAMKDARWDLVKMSDDVITKMSRPNCHTCDAFLHLCVFHQGKTNNLTILCLNVSIIIITTSPHPCWIYIWREPFCNWPDSPLTSFVIRQMKLTGLRIKLTDSPVNFICTEQYSSQLCAQCASYICYILSLMMMMMMSSVWQLLCFWCDSIIGLWVGEGACEGGWVVSRLRRDQLGEGMHSLT